MNLNACFQQLSTADCRCYDFFRNHFNVIIVYLETVGQVWLFQGWDAPSVTHLVSGWRNFSKEIINAKVPDSLQQTLHDLSIWIKVTSGVIH